MSPMQADTVWPKKNTKIEKTHWDVKIEKLELIKAPLICKILIKRFVKLPLKKEEENKEFEEILLSI